MLSLPPAVRVFVALEPMDMRKSFPGLEGETRRLRRSGDCTTPAGGRISWPSCGRSWEWRSRTRTSWLHV
jgi:hypothetical protein